MSVHFKSERSEKKRALEITITVSIVCLAAACSQSDSSRGEKVRQNRSAAASEVPVEVRTFSGRVALPKQADLAFHMGGMLAKLSVKEGQKVAKGQLIAQLRQAEFKARLEVIRGQLEQARTALSSLQQGERPDDRLQHEAQEHITTLVLTHAQNDFDRYERLFRLGYVSRSQYEQAETTFLVAQEEHKVALRLLKKGTTAVQEDIETEEGVIREISGQLAEAKLELDDTTLYAPFDGVVDQRLADQGESIAADKTVVRLNSIDAVEIVVDRPGPAKTSDICSPNIVAMLAEITEVPGPQYPVRLKSVPQLGDRGTQAPPIRFEMKAPFGVEIFPGMTATVSVRYRAGADHTPAHSSSPCKLGTR